MKKKICFVVASPLTAIFFLEKHFEYLSKAFDLYLVANLDDHKEFEFSKKHLAGYHHISISRNINLGHDFSALFELRGYLKKMNFDAVISVTPKAGFIGMLAARLAGIPFRLHVFTGQVWHTKTGLFKSFLMGMDRWIVRNATRILVDGESQRQFLIQNGIVSDAQSRVLGKGSISGVNTSRFQPTPEVRAEVRKQLGYTDQNLVFAFLSRLTLDKGVVDLANAFVKLKEKYPHVRLLFVGYDEENLQPRLAEIIGDPDSVCFFGGTKEVPKILQAGDVFCFPSYREGFGTSVIEAALLELPVICSDTYGLGETIIDGQTGLRHPVGNSEILFQQMEKMVLDETLRHTLAKNGRQYVLDNFSAEKISQAWFDYFTKELA
jgi:glycosyltransferase involved in cell wall biosynthesis